MTTPSPPPGRGRRLLFGAITVLMVLLAIEVGARALLALRVGPDVLLYGLAPTRDHHTVAMHDDLRPGYSKYFPNQRRVDFDPDTGETFAVGINRHGFRGEDFEIGKAPGVLRVVALGASSTFGYHSRDDETWPVRLEEELAGRCDAPVEVINLGIPHLMSEQIVALYRSEGRPLRPDVVLFYEGVNDASARRDRQGARRKLRRIAPLRTTWRALRDHLVVARFVDDQVRPRVHRWSAGEVAQHVEGRAERFLGSLEELRDLCTEDGAILVVATQQARSYRVPREEIHGVTYAAEVALVEGALADRGALEPTEVWFLTHARLMTALRGWTGREGVPLVDAIVALDPAREVITSWVHLTPEGNRRLAAAFAPVVAEHLCPGSSR
jgi:lysophospholipase L1-like esterase